MRAFDFEIENFWQRDNPGARGTFGRVYHHGLVVRNRPSDQFIPVLPYGIHPLAAFVNTATYFALAYTLFIACRYTRGQLLSKLGRCPSCGYPRRGLVTTTPCPECGPANP
jgi:ssDNA-binding Zn-finger/Zn-ribbon topoisomerase 1